MRQRWDDYERSGEKGPLGVAIRAVVGIAILVVVVGGIGTVFGWFGEAAQVAREELGPRALLQKYEWFKDAAAQLDKKRADIKVYEGRITSMDEDYQGTPRKDWPRDEREQRSQWQSEVAGVKASYNALAAEYNSQMAKENWRFTNVGDLPKGATEVLPREFREYVSE